MKPKIIRVGHVGASIERGLVYSPNGVMGAVTATCHKGPPLILTNISSSAKLMNKENCDETTRKQHCCFRGVE